MKKEIQHVVLVVAMVSACAASFAAGAITQESLEGAVFESGDTRVKILFDGLGRDVPLDVGIMTFPPGMNSGDHQHDQTEIFYVLEGTLEHVVNGESTILEPGMLGHVTPPDFVNHVTPEGASPTRALVMWSPAGGAARYARIWNQVEGR
jgi:quercetin dioxygenase-like cupin family protein